MRVLAVATAVVGFLWFAVGVRQARPKPSQPPRRRAFSEHVEAVGALYARTRNAAHALAAFSRFADDDGYAAASYSSGKRATSLAPAPSRRTRTARTRPVTEPPTDGVAP